MTYMIRLRGETEELAVICKTREDAEHNARVFGLAPAFDSNGRLEIKMTDEGLRKFSAA